MTTSLLSVPTPHRSPLSQCPYISSSRWSHGPSTHIRFPPKLIPLCSSSSSSTSIVEEGPPSPSPSPPPSDALPVQLESPIQDSGKLPLRGCKACGKEEIEKGCNGEGRIQGGIATVPGFGWWPIKAYRPCPGFVASGGRYRRRGQSMDEVAFGRGEAEASMGTNNEVQSSKKKQSPRKFKS